MVIKIEEGRGPCKPPEKECRQERPDFCCARWDRGELGVRQENLNARIGEKLFSHM